MIVIEKLLLFCAGVDEQIIQREECSTEKSKYAAIGGTVLFTTVLAYFSGGYALWTVFEKYFLSGFLGLIWALGIFNLDRSFVINIKKKEKNKPLRLLGTVAPRLFLAGVIAFTISKPIELKLFERDIEVEIEKENVAARNAQIKILSEDPRLIKLQNDLSQLNLQKQKIQERQSERANKLICEASGTCGTREYGDGPATQAIRAAQAQDTEMIKELDKQIQAIKRQIAPLEKANEIRLAEVIAAQNNADGFLRQLEVFDKLSKSEEHKIVMFADGFITLLFILLETAPIIVKLLSERGPYDAIVEHQEESSIHLYSEKTKALKEVVEHEIGLYLKNQKDKQVFDANADLANYKRARQTLKNVSYHLFTEIFDNTLESKEWEKAQKQLIEKLTKQLEKELIDYAQNTSSLEREVKSPLRNVSRDFLEQIISTKLQEIFSQIKMKEEIDKKGVSSSNGSNGAKVKSSFK